MSVGVAKVFDLGTGILCAIAALAAGWAIAVRIPAGAERPASPTAAEQFQLLEKGRIDMQAFQSMAESGMRIGPPDAPVTVVVFNDYSCGACAKYHEVLERLRNRYPEHVALVYKHYLPTWTRQTLQVAQAAECAADQGALPAFNNVMFASPEAKLVSSWVDLGRTVGVSDPQQYESCVHSNGFRARILEDTEQATAIGVQGTPSTLVNGLPALGALPFGALNELVGHELDRKVRW